MRRWAGCLIGLCGLLVACDDGASPCVIDAPPADCAPLYPPTFDQVYARTLMPTCALGGCHDAYAAKGMLVLDTPDAAYDALVQGGRADPGCAMLLERIDSHEPGWQMPPGQRLSTAERCAVHQWINAGALR